MLGVSHLRAQQPPSSSLVVAHAFVAPARRLLAPQRLAAPTSNEGRGVRANLRATMSRHSAPRALSTAGGSEGRAPPRLGAEGRAPQFGFVTFALRSAASAAIASGRIALAGRKMVVSAQAARQRRARRRMRARAAHCDGRARRDARLAASVARGARAHATCSVASALAPLAAWSSTTWRSRRGARSRARACARAARGHACARLRTDRRQLQCRDLGVRTCAAVGAARARAPRRDADGGVEPDVICFNAAISACREEAGSGGARSRSSTRSRRMG